MNNDKSVFVVTRSPEQYEEEEEHSGTDEIREMNDFESGCLVFDFILDFNRKQFIPSNKGTSQTFRGLLLIPILVWFIKKIFEK